MRWRTATHPPPAAPPHLSPKTTDSPDMPPDSRFPCAQSAARAASADRQLHRLRHAVVHHLRRRHNRALARNKDDPSAVPTSATIFRIVRPSCPSVSNSLPYPPRPNLSLISATTILAQRIARAFSLSKQAMRIFQGSSSAKLQKGCR
jgi:hypothetical protein